MARISYSKSKNSTTYYIIDDYKRNGKRTTRKLETIGNINKITELASTEQIDIKSWLNNYLENYKKDHLVPTNKEKIIIEKHKNKLIPKDVINNFNVGYLFFKRYLLLIKDR